MNTVPDHRVPGLCLDLLRWLGLSFTTMEESSTGDLIATHSKFHLFVNLIIAAAFVFLFCQLDLSTYASTEKIYRSSMIVYPLYTKMMSLTIVLFSLCGNVYSRKFVDMINRFRRVARRVAGGVESSSSGRGRNGLRTLVRLFVYMGVMTGVNLWVDAHLTLHFGGIFRFVHYLCFYYTTVLTGHFVVTMNYIRESFGCVNGALGRAEWDREGGGSARGDVWVRKKMSMWMERYLELREAEGLVNEVFGKQIFLTLMLAFSSAIVNVYYMISLNLYETTYEWLNVLMYVGLVQALLVAVVSTRAAELAACEANRVNEVIFEFLIRYKNRQMYNQIKYFTLFNYYYPMEFRVWIFYGITNDSLFKVILTSSAVITVILQCDFLRGTSIVIQ